MIQYGDADVMVVGGAETATSPITVAGFASMRALSGRNDEPEKPVGRGTKTETALCWVKGQAYWCWKNTSAQKREGRRS